MRTVWDRAGRSARSAREPVLMTLSSLVARPHGRAQRVLVSGSGNRGRRLAGWKRYAWLRLVRDVKPVDVLDGCVSLVEREVVIGDEAVLFGGEPAGGAGGLQQQPSSGITELSAVDGTCDPDE